MGPALFPVDTFGQRLHLVRLQVIDHRGDTLAADGGDQLGGLLDGLGRPDSLALPQPVRPVT